MHARHEEPERAAGGRLVLFAFRAVMQPVPQPVCISMEPYDAQDPTWHPPVRSLDVETHRDHVLWSLFNFFFFNYFCCLGFAALVFSVKSRDRKMAGDPDGAAHYGKTAKGLNITVTVLAILAIVSLIIFVIVMFSVTKNSLFLQDDKKWQIPYYRD